jgi:hypothetical protein
MTHDGQHNAHVPSIDSRKKMPMQHIIEEVGRVTSHSATLKGSTDSLFVTPFFSIRFEKSTEENRIELVWLFIFNVQSQKGTLDIGIPKMASE